MRCEKKEVLTAAEAEVLIRLAGFRNRMVHFYHAIGDEELAPDLVVTKLTVTSSRYSTRFSVG